MSATKAQRRPSPVDEPYAPGPSFSWYQSPNQSAPQGSYAQAIPPTSAGQNGVARSSSRRQRASEGDSLDMPAAPEAPQRTYDQPPAAYRDPYERYESRAAPSTKSFAARASAIQSQLGSGSAPQNTYPPVPAETTRSHARRSSEGQPVRMSHPAAQHSPQQTYATTTQTPQRSVSGSDRRTSGRGPPRASVQPIAPRAADIRPTQKSATDWAADRSPLQRLEVKLNDISKEEKRARVQEAEQRLREKRASQGLDNRPARTDSRRVVSDPRGASATTNRQPAGVDPSVRDSMARRNFSGPAAETSRRSQTSGGAAAAIATAAAEASPRESKDVRRTSLVTKGTEPGRPRRSLDSGRPDDRAVRFQSEVGEPQETPTRLPQPKRSSKAYQELPASESVRPRQGSIQAEDDFDVAERQDDANASARASAHAPALASAHGAHDHHLKHQLPPQTEAGKRARQQVGFGMDIDAPAEAPTLHRHHLPHIFHRQHPEQSEAQPSVAAPYLDEWKQGGVARLMLDDAVAQPLLSPKVERKKAWWEQSTKGRQGGSHEAEVTLFDGAQENSNGIKREQGTSGQTTRETWRGSVMVVTTDSQSVYEPAPILRLYHQPMDLLPPPPSHFDESKDEDLPSEYVDPIGGLPKMTRTGGTVWVKPAEDLEIGRDVSVIENDDGLYEAARTANVPSDYGRVGMGASPQSKGKTSQSGRFKEVKGVRLHAERGVTFWRFNLEVELGNEQTRVAYRINRGASIGFWVPARDQTMNVMFHSCNGFSLSVDPNTFSGPDPLWRDVLNAHQTQPFHIMIGGGDQIYNDAVVDQTRFFHEWTEERNPHRKHQAEFTNEMQDELETFYLERYSMWFSQGLFGMANSQIPMVNIWDDHDIIDGFGSYPDSFMNTPVFCGLGNVAYKYYMLFQHQSVDAETEADEPSWVLGAGPGPYISTLSRSVFVSLGRRVAFLGLDCRTERTREEILSEQSYDSILDRCRRELVRGETHHLIVLLGVPIAYPRLVWLENVLTSRALDPLKALGRMGLLGGFMNKFDGGVEILDDLDDHWTAKNHKEERNWFIEELQDLAAEKSVRITILGGDVHLAAVGQFYSNKSMKISKDKDHRYMPNVISSAIVNTPPPDVMADVLNRRNKIHHLNRDTDEDMIPMFTHDVDGKPRNNKHLLPKRNWCSITEYVPGSTPPPTPPSLTPTASEESLPQESVKPPSALQRTLSLGSGSKPGKLIRRLSLGQRPTSYDQSPSPPLERSGPRGENTAAFHDVTPPARDSVPAPLPTRPNTFQRRPTTLEMAAKKGGGDDSGQINLEWGLDIKLNCEIKQGDPSGVTESYRLLVPALFYADAFAPEPRKPTLVRRLTDSMRAGSKSKEQDWSGSEGSEHSDEDSEFGVTADATYTPPQEAAPPPPKAGFFRIPARGTSLLRKRNTAPPMPGGMVPFRTRPKSDTAPFQPGPRVPMSPQQGGQGVPQRSASDAGPRKQPQPPTQMSREAPKTRDIQYQQPPAPRARDAPNRQSQTPPQRDPSYSPPPTKPQQSQPPRGAQYAPQPPQQPQSSYFDYPPPRATAGPAPPLTSHPATLPRRAVSDAYPKGRRPTYTHNYPPQAPAAPPPPSQIPSQSRAPPPSRRQGQAPAPQRPSHDDASETPPSSASGGSDEAEDLSSGDEDLAPPLAQRRVASKFDASGSSKFFGAAKGTAPLRKGGYGTVPRYVGSGSGNGNGKGGLGGYEGEGGEGDGLHGYEGIEAFKEKKGWRRLLGGR